MPGDDTADRAAMPNDVATRVFETQREHDGHFRCDLVAILAIAGGSSGAGRDPAAHDGRTGPLNYLWTSPLRESTSKPRLRPEPQITPWCGIDDLAQPNHVCRSPAMGGDEMIATPTAEQETEGGKDAADMHALAPTMGPCHPQATGSPPGKATPPTAV